MRDDLGDLSVEAEIDSVRPVQIRERRAHLRSERPEQRQLGGFDNRHLDLGRARRGGHLQPDPARADDHNPAGLAEEVDEGVGVGDGAQCVDVGASAPGIATRRGVEPVANASLV